MKTFICKGTTLLKRLIFSYQCLILFLPETVSTDIVGCVSIVDESIGSYQISASVSPEKEEKKKKNLSQPLEVTAVCLLSSHTDIKRGLLATPFMRNSSIFKLGLYVYTFVCVNNS